MAVKGIFGIGARTFGNPSGAHSGDGGTWTSKGSGAATAFFATSPTGSVWTAGSHIATDVFTFAKGTLFLAALANSNAVRLATTASGLATAADVPVAGLDPAGLADAFARGGFYLGADGVGGVATSNDAGVTWTSTTLPGGLALGQAGVSPDILYDDVNAVLIALASDGADFHVVTAPLPVGVAPIVFTDQGIFGTGDLRSIGYRAGSGTTLALDGVSNIWQSTDGGVTWAQIAVEIFGATPGNLSNILWGQTHWVAATQKVPGGITISHSTDGITWVASPIAGGLANNQATLATDNANHWVVFAFNSTGTLNYAVSTDDGVTFNAPGSFNNNGLFCIPVVWDGAQFNAEFNP